MYVLYVSGSMCSSSTLGRVLPRRSTGPTSRLLRRRCATWWTILTGRATTLRPIFLTACGGCHKHRPTGHLMEMPTTAPPLLFSGGRYYTNTIDTTCHLYIRMCVVCIFYAWPVVNNWRYEWKVCMYI